MLLDAYYIIDKGIAEAVKAEVRKGQEAGLQKGVFKLLQNAPDNTCLSAGTGWPFMACHREGERPCP